MTALVRKPDEGCDYYDEFCFGEVFEPGDGGVEVPDWIAAEYAKQLVVARTLMDQAQNLLMAAKAVEDRAASEVTEYVRRHIGHREVTRSTSEKVVEFVAFDGVRTTESREPFTVTSSAGPCSYSLDLL